MNMTIEQYIKSLDNDRLYSLYEKVLDEMNKRKKLEREVASSSAPFQIAGPHEVGLSDDYVITA